MQASQAKLQDPVPWEQDAAAASIGKALLAPTVIYVRQVLDLAQRVRVKVRLLASAAANSSAFSWRCTELLAAALPAAGSHRVPVIASCMQLMRKGIFDSHTDDTGLCDSMCRALCTSLVVGSWRIFRACCPVAWDAKSTRPPGRSLHCFAGCRRYAPASQDRAAACSPWSASVKLSDTYRLSQVNSLSCAH